VNPNQLLTYDQLVTAICLLREAGGESLPVKAAVLSVIHNRANDPRHRWPRTLHEVVLQKYQFSSFNANDPNVTKWPKASVVGDWLAFWDCVGVVLGPFLADATGGAQFYHDVSIAPPAEAWLGKGRTVEELERMKTLELGRLVFYAIP
jgi:hypothetical protein